MFTLVETQVSNQLVGTPRRVPSAVRRAIQHESEPKMKAFKHSPLPTVNEFAPEDVAMLPKVAQVTISPRDI